jgi:hypothetical protein
LSVTRKSLDVDEPIKPFCTQLGIALSCSVARSLAKKTNKKPALERRRQRLEPKLFFSPRSAAARRSPDYFCKLA